MDSEEAPKHFQSQTCTKRSRSLFGSLLPILSTIAFWILAKSLHLRSMLNKLMKSTENCNACHQRWSKEGVQFFSMTTPDCTLHDQHFESWTMKLCLVCHIHLTSCHQLPLLQAFWQLFVEKTLPQSAGWRKCFPRVRWIPKHGFLCYKNKQTYFLLAKMCWLKWFLFWLMKMCLNLAVLI